MAKIDVELTSRRDDGNWTWRAVGAREPKGTVDSSLLSADVSIGSQFSVETEHFIDGIVVTKVFEKKQSSDKGDFIEILGSSKNLDHVTTQLAKSKKGKGKEPKAKSQRQKAKGKKAKAKRQRQKGKDKKAKIGEMQKDKGKRAKIKKGRKGKQSGKQIEKEQVGQTKKAKMECKQKGQAKG